MLPQPDRQEPTPQPCSYFMLHGKGSRDGFSIFNYPAPSCFPPSQSPHLSWAVAPVQSQLGQEGPVAFASEGLVKTPFFDNSQSEAMTAPAPCQLLSWSCLEANCVCG